MVSEIEVRPLGPDTWDDWLAVMGPRGGTGGCFCMYYRMTSKEWDAATAGQNRERAEGLMNAGDLPGLIGYRDGVPVGWVQVGPRKLYPRLERSRIAKPVDDREAWAITCFVIPKQYRRQGVARQLLEKAVEWARRQGAEVVEGFPVEPKDGETADVWAWMGVASMFDRCGFAEVARRSPTRPYMRLEM
jgi:GNAT superfamily N-acetyltransferase